MPNIFFSNKRKIFRIVDFKMNEPLQIIDSNNYFLSCAKINNIVDFYHIDDNSNRQKWIIEKHESKENIYYIKCAFDRYNKTQYLGCPNMNNQVFLYTSKNIFTEWKITNIENKFYEITYNGDKFNPQEVCIVVSRHTENIEWALAYNDIAVIYNKGGKIKLPFKNIINLENIGREGHTYLYHIINNYDNLTDRCIFLQGNPIDSQTRNGLPDKFIENRWGDQPATSYKVEDYLFSNTFWVKNLRPSMLYCGENYGKVETNIDSDVTMRDFFEKYVKCKNLQNIPEPFYWFEKGQFLCTKQNVLSNSKEYYSHLITSVEYTSNPIEGHYLERFWYYILHRNLNVFNEQDKKPEVYFSNKRKIFRIDDFKMNEPLQIITSNNYFLSCAKINNIVDFYHTDDNSNRQKWVIEKHESKENIYYIKCAFDRYNKTQYLGCPNMNNQVFLYTSKNIFTEWKITNIENNIYEITYNGDKFNPQEVCMVVSRYNENIEWALAYNDIAVIYNKGDKIKLPFKNIINLENIGREGHTYLYHIIENYDNLTCDRIIFTQGSPFEHNYTFLRGVDNYHKLLDVQPLGLIYLEKYNIPPREIVEKYKATTDYGLEYLVADINANLCCTGPFDFHDKGIENAISTYFKRFPECKSLIGNFLEKSNFPINKQINEIRFTYSALFSLAKNKIYKYDISVYKNLINELTSYHSQGGENGYILERLWLYIFED